MHLNGAISASRATKISRLDPCADRLRRGVHSRVLSRIDTYVSILVRVARRGGVRSLPLTYAPGAGELGTLDPVHLIGEVLVKIDRLTAQERRAVREALRALVPGCGRRGEAGLAGALLMARIEEEARDLCAEFVRDARSEYRLTWSEIGAAFGITMQSAQWRFGRPRRKSPKRLRR